MRKHVATGEDSSGSRVFTASNGKFVLGVHVGRTF